MSRLSRGLLKWKRPILSLKVLANTTPNSKINFYYKSPNFHPLVISFSINVKPVKFVL